jgi:hypothetical protein
MQQSKISKMQIIESEVLEAEFANIPDKKHPVFKESTVL